MLAVTAVGADLAAARQAAYERVAGVRLAGAHWRTDIALAAVEGRSESLIVPSPWPRPPLSRQSGTAAGGPYT